MADELWLVIRDGQQLDGQYSDEQVLDLMQQHSSSNFFVWKSGMGEWADARTLPQFKGAAPPPPPGPPPPPADEKPAKKLFEGAAKRLRDSDDPHGYLPHLKLLDSILGWFGQRLAPERLSSIDSTSKKIGHIALIAAAFFIFVFGVIYSIKSGEGAAFLIYLLVFPALLIVQYVAVKFLDAGSGLIAKTPSSLSSRAVPECFALLALLAAIAAPIAGTAAAIFEESLVPFGTGLGACLIFLYMVGAALNAPSLNIDVSGQASAGEEAIGILCFLLKLNLRLVPFIFGVGGIVAILGILATLVQVVRANEFTLGFVMLAATSNFTLVLIIALLPFAVYLSFLIYYLLLDVMRAILAVPGKLDRLAPSGTDENASGE